MLDCRRKLIDADKAPDVKALTLHLLLIVTTASDNINLNSMIPYLLTNEVFEALVQLLVDNSQQLSPYTVLLLTAILSNYHKYELRLLTGVFIFAQVRIEERFPRSAIRDQSACCHRRAPANSAHQISRSLGFNCGDHERIDEAVWVRLVGASE